MARREEIKQRLEEWARWKVRRDSSACGFPRQSAFLNVHVDGARGSRVDQTEGDRRAAEIDEAVNALKMIKAKSHLARLLDKYYIEHGGLGAIGSARFFGRSESTIHTWLRCVDDFIFLWLESREVERERVRSAVSG